MDPFKIDVCIRFTDVRNGNEICEKSEDFAQPERCGFEWFSGFATQNIKLKHNIMFTLS